MATVNQIWPIGTDCKVVLSGLKDDAGAYVNDATVTANLVNTQGANVTNGTNITFTGLGSNGQYEAVLPYTLDLTADAEYTLNILAVAGNKRALLKMARRAAYIEI
jgi:hypothetical protein